MHGTRALLVVSPLVVHASPRINTGLFILCVRLIYPWYLILSFYHPLFILI